MHSHTLLRKQLVFLAVAVAALYCGGCGPSGTDAVKFANQQISQMKAQEPNVVQVENGMWYSEAMEIRNARPGYIEDGALEARVSYDFRMLRSPEFDTESEARDADLSPVSESWESKEDLFKFTDGEWKSKE